MKTIGILGGGQLGLMTAEAIQRSGGHVRIFGPAHSPAARIVPDYVIGDLSDQAALMEFVSTIDALTLEMEHIDLAALRVLELPVFPSLNVIAIVQHRLREKNFLAANDLPHAQFVSIRSENDIHAAQIEFPCISKTVFGGYDGRGQGLQTSRESLLQAWKALPFAVQQDGLVLEEIIEIEAELSVIVASAENSVAFPVIENLHRHHILDVSILPARIPESVQLEAQEIALKTASALNVKGLLTVEFFLTRRKPIGPSVCVEDMYLLINEMAPRPHNSGHVTRRACNISQFDALARILLGLPLVEPKTHPVDGGFVMGNLLSELWRSDQLNLQALEDPDILEFYLYGKTPDRPRRKMGHFLMGLSDLSTAEDRVHAVQRRLSSN